MTMWVSSGSVSSGATTKQQLDYKAVTDIASPISPSADVWTDLIPNKSFTVDNQSSVIDIYVTALLLVTSGNAGTFSFRVNVDSAGTPSIKSLGGGGNIGAGGSVAVVAGGSISLTGLSAGAHTVKVQLVTNGASENFYCRALTLPNLENFEIFVLERLPR